MALLCDSRVGPARIGHVAEAQILQALGVDMIDESEVLTPADPFHHVDKRPFKVPFVPVLPVLGMLFCGGLMLNMARRSWIQLVIWLIIGALVYAYNHRKKRPAATV